MVAPSRVEFSLRSPRSLRFNYTLELKDLQHRSKKLPCTQGEGWGGGSSELAKIFGHARAGSSADSRAITETCYNPRD
jgi:hypothetical protein